MASYVKTDSNEDTAVMPTKRLVKLTEKGQAAYDAQVQYYCDKLLKLRQDIEKIANASPEFEKDVILLKKLFTEHEDVWCDFENYLQGMRTIDSELELSTQMLFSRKLTDTVFEIIQTVKSAQIDTQAQHKYESIHHRRHYVTVDLICHKTKAEQLKVKIEYAEKEAILKQEQAALQPKMELLSLKGQYHKEEAASRTIEQIMDSSINESSLDFSDTDSITAKPMREPRIPSYQASTPLYQAPTSSPVLNLNPLAQPYHPQQPTYMNMCVDFQKFMVWKDLLLSKLVKFTDNPEDYDAWKSTFTNIITELEIEAPNEMDLLIKWLGPRSSTQARRIKSANARDPQRGVNQVWETLNEIYGSPENIKAALDRKIMNFRELSDRENDRLYDLLDIVQEIESYMCDTRYANLLSYYNCSVGINPLVEKLPKNIKDKWVTQAFNYKQNHKVAIPPFSFLVNFIKNMAKMRNDPGFITTTRPSGQMHSTPCSRQPIGQVKAVKTELISKTDKPTEEDTNKYTIVCPYHGTRHYLNASREFRRKPLVERKDFVQNQGLCMRCCGPFKHETCTAKVKCYVCGTSSHPTAFHVEKNQMGPNGGEASSVQIDRSQRSPPLKHSTEAKQAEVKCTQVCGQANSMSKSCGKTILVDIHPSGQPERSVRMYAIIDDQSNQTLARSKFFDMFGERGNDVEYTLSSCSGSVTVCGRSAHGYAVKSVNGNTQLNLPTIIECEDIPNVRNEIPTPDVACHHIHMKYIAQDIPVIDSDAEILLLIGRDLPSAHHVIDQRIGEANSPFAQKLTLGWTIIGEVCLGTVHQTKVNVNKIYALKTGRPSLMNPCPYDITVSEMSDQETLEIFKKKPADNQPGLSREDREFMVLMDKGMRKTDSGNWTAPLPFRDGRKKLPDNYSQAERRARTLHNSMLMNETKREHMLTFMEKIIKRGHAEKAPPRIKGEETWYLPLFGVFPIRGNPVTFWGFFYSSAKQDGISLNSVIMSGPDLTNNLLGVLMRFRRHDVAITADIEQMFYAFKVDEEHRRYLRFLWYEDNDFTKPLIEYHMTAHVFGNSPSPAVATCGLRKSIEHAAPDVKQFVKQNFYVDDGLTSLPDVESKTSLLQRTQQTLKQEGNLRLHKIASNKPELLNDSTMKTSPRIWRISNWKSNQHLSRKVLGYTGTSA